MTSVRFFIRKYVKNGIVILVYRNNLKIRLNHVVALKSRLYILHVIKNKTVVTGKPVYDSIVIVIIFWSAFILIYHFIVNYLFSKLYEKYVQLVWLFLRFV